MKELLLPSRIKKHLSGLQYSQNNVGCSQAKVYRFYSETEVRYLKVEPTSGELKKEYENLLWMNDKLPVPRILEWVSEEETDYLLMTEIGGRMLCDEEYLRNPLLAVSVLAEGINLLRSIDINTCPLNNNLSRKLKNAELNIRNNKVDMEDWEPENNQFANPQDLLHYLESNQPKKEELVFSHGDYCLPNIFADGRRLTGFIDLGRAGVGDLWQDVALCMRSLWHNFNTRQYDDLLLQQIGIALNQEKLDYYILLDELF